ncbi:hypothetical protein MNL76_08030 [Fervidobacterium riparium]|uniref:J domain-containing protein n=1 Tax=Fervidobacterium gondwanense DSM 13020 TaxID=1121883 RepID=A0A1M7T8J5_FERGO|nr:hypothetical protein [Fervidobacterium gondwanense]UXF01337.1 hypothetical protein IB67_07255 [Fervidobacterium riparium]SHN67039.1 hypothetical protein SAMN02745226_01712 [Fervidobacterium gondwanense DSM 13020]
MRSVFEILNIPEDTPKQEVEKMYKETLEKYSPAKYENHPLRNVAQQRYDELIRAYEEYSKSNKSETKSFENVSHIPLGYRPGYAYYRRGGCCCDNDILEAFCCIWSADTCCECMGGDCVKCM